jgi:DNA repair protein RadC
MISSFLHDGEAVAQVGDSRLSKEELLAFIPSGITPEDSLRLAEQYINSWATDQVYLQIAEQQLSKEELDVTKELEEYRRSLIKYRYEQRYINERWILLFLKVRLKIIIRRTHRTSS